MKRILALLAVCLLLAGCGTQIPPVMVPPAIHTTLPPVPTAAETAPTNGVAYSEPTVPETVPPTTAETQPETQPTVPPTVPEVTEPGPQTIYADPEDLELTARHAFVYDCTSGDVWIWGDMNAQIAPASLVKLFTIHVAMDHLEPETLITAGDEVYLVKSGSSVAGIRKGSQLTAAMLVEGCLIQSGNDAAYVLAVAAGRKILGSDDASVTDALAAFMDRMNEEAATLGLNGTYYVNPDGFDAQGQHTCPADVLTVAKLSLADPLVMRYCGIDTDHVTFESGEDYIWYSTNFLLHPSLSCYCPEAFGLKTGTTDAAGAHLLAAFHAPDRDLIIGVFGCPNKIARFEEARLLFALAK